VPYNHSFEFPTGQKIEKIDEKSSEEIYDELPWIKTQKGMIFVIGDPSGDKGKGQNGEGQGNGKDGIKGGFDVHIYGDNLTKQEKEELEKKWKRELVAAATYAKQRGLLPKGIERRIGDLLETKIGWKHKLYKYIVNEIHSDFTWKRPSKRGISLGYYLPDVLRENIEVVSAIDTSGSIGEKELTEFLSELVAICRSFEQIKARILICDSKIHQDLEIANGNIDKILSLKPKGGGGTSHSEIVKAINEKYPMSKILILFTDGYSDLETEIPKLTPTCRTIIVLSENSAEAKKFEHLGEVIKLGKED